MAFSRLVLALLIYFLFSVEMNRLKVYVLSEDWNFDLFSVIPLSLCYNDVRVSVKRGVDELLGRKPNYPVLRGGSV
jgi:hypothetical protein